MRLSMRITIIAEMLEHSGNFGDNTKGRIRLMTAIAAAFAHMYQAICLTRHLPANLCRHFRLLKPRSRCSNIRSTTREMGSDFRGWAFETDGGARSVDGETFAGWGVIARSIRGSIDVLFRLVVSHLAHPAFSGARASSNITAEMTAMIEALYRLGPRGSVARQEEACIFYDSKHAAGKCLGTIQARTQVQLALACQRRTLCVQHRLRLTMQHVYGHGGNFGNECADHAAALGSLGFISSQNDAARWGRRNFDTNALCEGCNNISEILERLHHARTEATARTQDVS